MQINYIPARITEGATWHISYYVINPLTNKLVRKRVKLMRIKSVTERRKFARNLMHEVNVKLAAGWNPLIEQESAKSFHKFSDVLDTFLRIKTKELRKDSIRTYTSYAESFKYYLKDISKENCFVLDFDRSLSLDYLNQLYIKRNVSARVYNNHRNFGRLLFNWMLENQYSKTNPFVGIKSKKELDKTRLPIDGNYRDIIRNYLVEKNEHEFLAVCMLTFYTFLRPKEICLLKKDMVNIDKQTISLPNEITKNGKKRMVTIPNELIPYLQSLNIEAIDDKLYIFSTGFKPGKILKDSRYVGKRWTRMRKELNLPKELQFYSLKDTGIVQMLRDGVSPDLVRDQAGHSSLEVTNKYIKSDNKLADMQIKEKAGKF